ncbi:hypothetical protein Cgig2_004764 [Carnegiea gigantea]|uniref:Uncharacterized protein n=1 Tax=Carnegiea gigantea TaxID=171969 RepID=A0A9Q1KVJ9_9CARY|nr:hypothetical protein Cgig2_004764 [Carnegiea gigantea]
MAYLDPGNLETDLQAGANHRYGLLWVILIGLIFALIIQSLAANLGVCTGKHLSELCRAEYPVMVKYCLWMIAEIAVVAADIPEVIGTAFALNILFHLPIWSGVLFTGFSTLILLGLQRYGVRKLEMLIATLILVMAACFFGEMSYVRPPAKELIKGMFVPNFRGQGATADAIALLGALIMPYTTEKLIKFKFECHDIVLQEACKFFLLESGFALLIAFMIYVAVVTVAGAACSRNLTAKVEEQCSDLTLNSASFLLKNVLRQKSASIIYAIAVLASGQSSAISCTYSGQYIMQGFLGLKIKRWMRNLITRSLAIAPSLLVSIIGGSAGASRLIIIASVRLGIIGINVYYLFTGFMGWLSHCSLPRAGTVLVGIVVFPLMAVYVVAVAYLMFRKDRVVTSPPKSVQPLPKIIWRKEEATPIMRYLVWTSSS